MTDYDNACRLRTLAEQANDPAKYHAAGLAFDDIGMISAATAMKNRARYYEKERPDGWQTAAQRPQCPDGCEWRDFDGVTFCAKCGHWYTKDLGSVTR